MNEYYFLLALVSAYHSPYIDLLFVPVSNLDILDLELALAESRTEEELHLQVVEVLLVQNEL